MQGYRLQLCGKAVPLFSSCMHMHAWGGRMAMSLPLKQLPPPHFVAFESHLVPLFPEQLFDRFGVVLLNLRPTHFH